MGPRRPYLSAHTHAVAIRKLQPNVSNHKAHALSHEVNRLPSPAKSVLHILFPTSKAVVWWAGEVGKSNGIRGGVGAAEAVGTQTPACNKLQQRQVGSCLMRSGCLGLCQPCCECEICPSECRFAHCKKILIHLQEEPAKIQLGRFN
jgi:hypothetical protein